MSNFKKCNGCKTEKPLTEFYKHKQGKFGVRGSCKECCAPYYQRHYEDNKDTYVENTKRYRTNNREKWLEKASEYNLLSKYGLTPEGYADLLELQNGVCAICHRECSTGRNLAVDHDRSCCNGKYSCGECVRGLLCFRCNTSIARFEDNPELLKSAIDYLEGVVSNV